MRQALKAFLQVLAIIPGKNNNGNINLHVNVYPALFSLPGCNFGRESRRVTEALNLPINSLLSRTKSAAFMYAELRAFPHESSATIRDTSKPERPRLKVYTPGFRSGSIPPRS